MAEPQARPSPRASTVDSCSATDCVHNEDQDCHAGEIVVQMNGGSPACGTYKSEAPKTRP